MDDIFNLAKEYLNLFLLDPRSPAEFWIKLLAAGAVGGLFLSIVAGIFKMGNPNFSSGVVLFVGFSAIVLVGMAGLQKQLGWVIQEQGVWVGAIIWAMAASLLLAAPLLKVTWPGGYGSAVMTWVLAWAGALLVVLLVGASFSMAGAGRSVVKSERARNAEARELLKLDK